MGVVMIRTITPYVFKAPFVTSEGDPYYNYYIHYHTVNGYECTLNHRQLKMSGVERDPIPVAVPTSDG